MLPEDESFESLLLATVPEQPVTACSIRAAGAARARRQSPPEMTAEHCASVLTADGVLEQLVTACSIHVAGVACARRQSPGQD